MFYIISEFRKIVLKNCQKYWTSVGLVLLAFKIRNNKLEEQAREAVNNFFVFFFGYFKNLAAMLGATATASFSIFFLRWNLE